MCGDSAGGNLAAVVALHAGEAGMPSFRCQHLWYPVVDLTTARPSYTRYKDYLLTEASMDTFIARYTPVVGTRSDWRVSPIMAPHLSSSPPTMVYAAEYDVLRDEGLAFVERLRACGVDVTYREASGQMHAFLSFGKIIPEASEAMRIIAVDLKARLAIGRDMTARTE